MDSLPARPWRPRRPARLAAAPVAAIFLAGLSFGLWPPAGGARAAEADGAPMRAVDIPGFGALHLPVPEDWDVGSVTSLDPDAATEGVPEDAPRSASFAVSPDGPAHCEMNVSFSWTDMPDPAFNGPAALRALVDRMARAALEDSIESRYALREMRSPRGGGYYFTLRARAPRKKSQAYLTSGAFGLGNALLRFTLLSPQPDPPEAAEAIQLIAGARIDDEPAPAP